MAQSTLVRSARAAGPCTSQPTPLSGRQPTSAHAARRAGRVPAISGSCHSGDGLYGKTSQASRSRSAGSSALHVDRNVGICGDDALPMNRLAAVPAFASIHRSPYSLRRRVWRCAVRAPMLAMSLLTAGDDREAAAPRLCPRREPPHAAPHAKALPSFCNHRLAPGNAEVVAFAVPEHDARAAVDAPSATCVAGSASRYIPGAELRRRRADKLRRTSTPAVLVNVLIGAWPRASAWW